MVGCLRMSCLFGVEGAAFEEDRVWHANLADVVHRRGDEKQLRLCFS